MTPTEQKALEQALDPRRWTQEMNDAWCRNIPDLFAAFAALRACLPKTAESDDQVGLSVTNEQQSAPSLSDFERQAKYQGLQDFTKAEDKASPGDIPSTQGGRFAPATYYNFVTELAWRVWANKPSAPPQQDAQAIRDDSEEAARLQGLLLREFECYRPTHPNGLYTWAYNALLDTSPHRMKSPPTLPQQDAQAPRNDWKEALMDACSVAHIGWHEDDPRKTINDLISWHVMVELDPKVSLSAQAIHNAALDQAAKIPRAHALALDAGIFGQRWPEEATAICNASTAMGDKILSLKLHPDEQQAGNDEF